jgi:hypothetical protein
MYENPPLCMRMRPSGEIVAEVFGQDQLARVRAAFAALNIKPTYRVTTIPAFNAGMRRFWKSLRHSLPPRFRRIRISYRLVETLHASPDLDFEPQCPELSVEKPETPARSALEREEDAWADAAERRYGGDRVRLTCCSVEPVPEAAAPDSSGQLRAPVG